MSEWKILIVDDEERMSRVIADYFRIKGYETREAADGLAALKQFEEFHPDLILLDVMMPKMDGWEVCTHIRRVSSVPIIMLTARSEEEDELKGFSLGVDEYITKPFSLKILLARVEAVLRRGNSVPPTVATSTGLALDVVGRTVQANGQTIELTYTEFELLSYLMSNSGIALSRDKILDNVWRYDYYGDAHTVDTHIKKLRSKLGDYGNRIKTIRGIGYKYEVNG
ncbi:MAG: response regulator transcription factor [Clostridia bacterium]|nr:response regulator transcription factor [Clostridia bacterium]